MTFKECFDIIDIYDSINILIKYNTLIIIKEIK